MSRAEGPARNFRDTLGSDIVVSAPAYSSVTSTTVTSTLGVVIASLVAAITATLALMVVFRERQRLLATLLFLEIVVLLAIGVRHGGNTGAPLLLIPAMVVFALFFGRKRV